MQSHQKANKLFSKKESKENQRFTRDLKEMIKNFLFDIKASDELKKLVNFINFNNP